MKAVIMAGGEGTRLRPLTYNQPKPLVPIANRPLMEHVVTLLRKHGFTDIIVTVAFQAGALKSYFGDGSDFGVRISYAHEDYPLGTAGSVRNAARQPAGNLAGGVMGSPGRQLDETFLVISGDVLTDIDLSSVVDFHLKKKAIATLALRSVQNPLEFGLVITGDDGRVERFLEKPSWGQVFSDTINTGVYVLEPEIFEHIPPGMADFSADIFPGLLRGGRLFGYVTCHYWEDIGNLEAYARVHKDIFDGQVQVEVPGFSVREGVWLGEGAEVSPAAEVKGPAIIGDYCTVGPGAMLGEYTVLGRNVRVSEDVRLERAIVHDNAHLGPGAQLLGCTVGRGVELRRGARVLEGAVLGDECFVGEDALVHPGVKIYPFKTVEEGAMVNSSIVWESRGARSLFGANGVSGLANVDVSPELAQRLAMAYATTLAPGSTVVVSRDTSRAARILAQSIAVGLNAAGVDVALLDVATVPVTRFAVRSEHAAGGITARLCPEDPQAVSVRFFGGDGIDVPESAQRKIERVYRREDFRRCLASEIGDVRFPVMVADLYARVLLEQVEVEAVRAARFKVVLDYAYGTAAAVMPLLLGKLGAEVLALNPYAAARQSVSYDRWEHACGVAALVRSSGADFGAVLSPDGEQVTLIDGDGRILSHHEAMLVLLGLVLERRGARPYGPKFAKMVAVTGEKRRDLGSVKVALPVSAPAAAEAMCLRAGAALVSTELAASHVMAAAKEPGAKFAAGHDGGFAFPDFLPAFDGIAALVHAFALLAGTGSRLADLVARLPPVWTAHEEVVTPWEKKGSVMRRVMDLGRPYPTVMVDGIKVVHDDGWCLVFPDPEDAVTHIWAEAGTESGAHERAAEYAVAVREMLNS